MKNPIKKLEIKNFKTAKNISLDCKRINIIIGKPNVGKSNILEAISLLGSGPYSFNQDRYLSEFIRYDRFEDLFYDKETINAIQVKSDIGICQIRSLIPDSNYYYMLAPNDKEMSNLIEKTNQGGLDQMALHFWKELSGHQTNLPVYVRNIQMDGKVSMLAGVETWQAPVKKYDFKKYSRINNRFHYFLLPSDGNNLYAVVNNNKKFFSEIASFFKEYKLNFVLKKKETEFALQKNVKGVVYEYQYNLIADTLQRIIFYLMAIGSNKESILILEEPETHSFPVYTKLLAKKIIESKENQFFVSTHSPFILNTIIENAPLEEVAVFVASYENFQTKVKPLSKRELEDMLNYGNDIFFSDKLNGK